MTKESIYSQENRRIIFRETFQDEQTVRRGGGKPTDVTFSKGVGIWDGTNGQTIAYSANTANFRRSDAFSLRCKVKFNSSVQTVAPFHKWLNNLGYMCAVISSGVMRFFGNGQGLSGTAGKVIADTWQELVWVFNDGGDFKVKFYIDGVLDTETAAFTALFQTSNPLGLMEDAGGYDDFDGEMDMAEIYNYALDQYQVKNLYENKRFKALTGQDEILNISAQKGSIVSKYEGKETWLIDPGKGTFDSGTESWTKFNNNTIENDNGALKVTYVDNQYGARVTLSEASDLSTNLVIGKTYRIRVKAKVNTGSSVDLYVSGPSATLATVTATSFTWYEGIFVATYESINNFRGRNMGAGEIIWIDEWYIVDVEQAPTLTDMAVFKDGEVRTLKYNGSSSVMETTLANDINSVLFWMRPETDTESIIDLGGGNTITTSGGTLTAAWADDLYVNGAVGTAVNTGTWNLILCTVDTAIAITDIDIGKISAAFYSGLLNDFKIHEGVVSANESSQAWSNGRILYQV